MKTIIEEDCRNKQTVLLFPILSAGQAIFVLNN